MLGKGMRKLLEKLMRKKIIIKGKKSEKVLKLGILRLVSHFQA
jgi:hypothetical protein